MPRGRKKVTPDNGSDNVNGKNFKALFALII